MKIFAKNKISYSMLIIASSLAVTVSYQNCAKLNIEDLDAPSRAAAAERLAIGADDEIVVAGANVPDLKMFFVVDNSGTMSQNQLNLSQSFGSMFDASSTDSLSKFDTSAILISTAQKSPSITSSKAALDFIANQQKNYTTGMTVTPSDFTSLVRSAAINFGFLPGDNVGYQLTASVNPLKYIFMPAPVLGTTTDASGKVSFNSVIRKLASEPSVKLESDFKSRLAVLNSDRIQLVQTSPGVYASENSDVLDNESGLCAVARILRNPGSTIKSGDLLSFTIVSDENDNDPAGLNCVQSATQLTGAEDVVDGFCSQKQTSISYQTTSTTPGVDQCKLSGRLGYAFNLSYSINQPKTQLTYKYVTKAATYKAPYTDLTYKAQSFTYTYLNTQVTYYFQNCVTVKSDGQDKKVCTDNPTPTTSGWRVGDLTSATDCYAFAKSLNDTALNTAGKQPVCKTAQQPIASCNTSDTKCVKSAPSLTDRTVYGLVGLLSPAECLAKAQSYSDYNSTVTPSCKDVTRTQGSCSAAETAAGCSLFEAQQTAFKQGEVSGDYTRAAPYDCVAAGKSIYGNAVSTAADAYNCTKIDVAVPQNYAVYLPFKSTASIDGGTSLPVGGACGALSSLAISSGQAANSNIPASATCTITAYTSAPDTWVNTASSDCTSLANARCSADSLRSCSGSYIAGQSTTGTSSAIAYKNVQESISCSSKCGDSKLGACDASASPDITVAQNIKNLFGATATCSSSTSDVATSKVNYFAQPVATQSQICMPTLAGIPTYFTVTKNAYRTSGLDIDYVAGTKKDSNGNSVPNQNLVDYIQSRIQALTGGNAIISALVRTGTDSLGTGGSYGVDYEKLVKNTNGQIGSVLSNDYSIILKDLSRVIKSNIQRTMVLKKMKATQVVKKVSRVIASTGKLELIDPKLWKQNGTSLVLDGSLDMNDGDQYKVEFQNY